MKTCWILIYLFRMNGTYKGDNWLYGDYRDLPDMSDGFVWCLFNNKRGTNFKLWCEDDCYFEFELAVKDYCMDRFPMD